MSTKFDPQPPLRKAALNRRVDALFKAMSTDFLLREQFVTEPSQVLAEYVHATKLDPEQAAASDHFLYSVMANQSLLSWFRDYAIRQRGVVPQRSRFMPDFTRAVVAHDAHHVVLALAKSSADKQDVLGVFESFLPIIFNAFAGGLRAQTEMSTGHTTGTEMSTGHIAAGGLRAQTEMSTGHTTGTEMSTGHIAAGGLRAQTEMSTGHTTGTEMSTGHIVARLRNIFLQPGIFRAQTEMSTGHTTGTEMSTGHIAAGGLRAQTEMSTGHTTGTEMSTGHIAAGGLRAQTEMSTGHTTGTEMSTGHIAAGGLRAQTEMSTGHTTGTEKSTGHIIGSDVFQVGFERVTLAALVDHAIHLQEIGALDII